jgi:hypothetical protein
MDVSGHCFCGHIQYTATIDESLVAICHCTSCQRNSGTAFGVVVNIVDDSFKLLSGTLKSYESYADSGALRSRTFCPECGTRIYASTVGAESGFTGLRVGTCDQRDQLVPSIQLWCRSALPWAVLDGIPQLEKQDRG